MALSRHIGCQDTAQLRREKVEDLLQFLEFSFTSLLSLLRSSKIKPDACSLAERCTDSLTLTLWLEFGLLVNIFKPINVTQHILISVDSEETYGKVQHSFIIKPLMKLGGRNIPQDNKGYIWCRYGQCYIANEKNAKHLLWKCSTHLIWCLKS